MKHYAVIDTNVLVSAFLKWDSVPGLVMQAVFDGRIVPVLNFTVPSHAFLARSGQFSYNDPVVNYPPTKVSGLVTPQ